jgi:hypothetical protein
MYGEDYVRSAIGQRTPEESRQRLVEQLLKMVPTATEKQVLKLLK